MIGGDVRDADLRYRFVWKGNNRDLNFDHAADRDALEFIYNNLNREKIGKKEDFLTNRFVPYQSAMWFVWMIAVVFVKLWVGGNSKTLNRAFKTSKQLNEFRLTVIEVD